MATGRQSERERLGQAAALLNSLLSSPEAIRSLSTTVQQPDAGSHVSVDGELRALFPSGRRAVPPSAPPMAVPARRGARFEAQQHYGAWTTGRRKRAKGIYHDVFNKDVILLPNPTWEVVCRHQTKQKLHDNGHILSAFEFQKTWDYSTVLQQIREGFGDKIPKDVSLQCLMGCGNKLISPTLREGQDLTAFLLHKVYKSKALYLRPSRPLMIDDSDEGENEDSPKSHCTTRAMSRHTATSSHTAASGEIEEESSSPAIGSHTPTSSHSPTSYQTPTRSHTSTSSHSPTSNQTPTRSHNFTTSHTSTSSHIPTSSHASTSSHIPTSSHASTSSHIPTSSHTSTSSHIPTSSHTSTSSHIPRSSTIPPRSTMGDDYTSYLSITTALSDTSSDEEELNQAIMASIESQIASQRSGNIPVKNILLELAEKINTNQQCRFNINRSAVLDGAIRGFKRLSYDPKRMMSIKFSDDLGRNEEAIDLGGPRREFLRLLMEAMAESPMFEGTQDRQNLALDSTALREDRYFFAGRAIAVSLVHGGPPPGFLSPTFYNCLVGGPETAKPLLEDIADTDLREKVKKILECTSLDDLLSSTSPLIDYLANAGCLRPLRSIADRDLLVQDILMFQAVHRVQGPFQRFREGLKTLGVLEKIQQHPDSFRPLFCHEPCPLTADKMDDLFDIHLSTEGSNKRVAEEVVVTFWRDYLQDAEDEKGPSKLQKILVFATGASVIPAIGFSPKPSVEFLHEEAEEPSKLMFPMANTCVNCLKLPLHLSYQVFKDNMDFALGNTHGFGRQ